MSAIFLSYRRADTSGYAGRLGESLARHFGRENVFRDVEGIAPGNDFTDALDAAVARCEVLLVLIGDTWLVERNVDGSRRLDDTRDFVRLEIETALRRGIPVLPVLLEGATMPRASELPESIAALTRHQAIEISDTRWDYDFRRLVQAIASLTGTAPRRRRRLVLAAFAAGAIAITASAWLLVAPPPPDVSGRWDLPNGSWWVVVQDGDKLEIEEVHYQSKAVWLRGSGRIEGDRILFDLDAVFDRGTARGHLDIAARRKTLKGEMEMLPRGVRRSLLLVRPD
jgi:hypothetical protein